MFRILKKFSEPIPIKGLFVVIFIDVSLLKIDQQTLPGLKSLQNLEGAKKGLPDGVIYNDEKCLIIECKINLELTEDQLIRHERTVKRKGFNNTFGLTITKDPILNFNLKNWIHITWKEVYNWAYEEKSISNWSLKLLDYFRISPEYKSSMILFTIKKKN